MKSFQLTKNNHNKYLFCYSLIIIAFLLLGFVCITYLSRSVAAAPVVGFNAGKIMDDSVFANADTMNPTQIQSFLNGKVPVCNTWHAAGYGQNPPFTCLKDYSENGKSAAQIIYNTAQQYRINPQVFLVLLQKEQGLVTDTWPLNSQYRTATGYGCPDTAPCNSQYYGLTNQLQWSGKMFRSILDNSPNWYTPYVLGNNHIRWSPNSSCGGSTVNIQNRATQALYNYTPYQPNQAALNAGYGTGDGCSAYGNRNFYLYFTDWFGSPIKPPLPACNAGALSCVYGFKNEDNGKSFYTSDLSERDQVYKANFTFTGIAFYSRKADVANTLPVWRLYSTTSGFHLWTANMSEKNSLLGAGTWRDEGITFYMDPLQANTGAPVKRLYTQHGSGRHVFSGSPSEIQSLKSSGYIDEGDVFQSSSTRAHTPIPSTGKNNIYRLFFSDRHFWTSSVSERDSLIMAGVRYEGAAWETPINGTVPVYRIYSQTGYHFWTTNINERNQLIKSGWRDEGVTWKTLESGQATYRLYNSATGKHLFTTSLPEKNTLSNTAPWRYEGIAWYQ